MPMAVSRTRNGFEWKSVFHTHDRSVRQHMVQTVPFAHDGITNLDKYAFGLSPNVQYLFPIIDTFSTPNGWAVADNLAVAYTGLADLTGTAVGQSYVGFFSKYVGNYLFDWSKYGFIRSVFKTWVRWATNFSFRSLTMTAQPMQCLPMVQIDMSWTLR